MCATGRLVIRPERCRGCRSCQLACSFARTGECNPSRSCIELERDIATEKTAPLIRNLLCDFCHGRPACADACTYGAIVFEDGAKAAVCYCRGDRVDVE